MFASVEREMRDFPLVGGNSKRGISYPIRSTASPLPRSGGGELDPPRREGGSGNRDQNSSGKEG